MEKFLRKKKTKLFERIFFNFNSNFVIFSSMLECTTISAVEVGH